MPLLIETMLLHDMVPQLELILNSDSAIDNEEVRAADETKFWSENSDSITTYRAPDKRGYRE